MAATAPAVSPSDATEPNRCSERRAAANRRNAKKSTGPKTPAGKIKAAMNSLKDGLRARTPMLPGEDTVERYEFLNGLLDDLAPRTPIEYELAERVVGLCWRRRRLWRAEDHLIEDARMRLRPATVEEGDEEEIRQEMEWNANELLAKEFRRPLKVKGIPMESGDCGLLRLYEHQRRLDGSIDAALRMLLKLQDRRRKRNKEQGLPEDGAEEQIVVPIDVEDRTHDALRVLEEEEEREEREEQEALAAARATERAPAPNEPTDPRRGKRSAAPDSATCWRDTEESGAAQSLPRREVTVSKDEVSEREPVSDATVHERATGTNEPTAPAPNEPTAPVTNEPTAPVANDPTAPVTNEPTAAPPAPLEDRDEDPDDWWKEDPWNDPDDVDDGDDPVQGRAPGTNEPTAEKTD